MNEKRDFKGIWIPKEIWLSEDLSLQEKVFLVEIDSLDNENGCFAGNEYFAKFFGLSKTRVSIIINGLVKKDYINSEIEYKKGTKQILKRVLKVCYRPYITKVKDPIKEKLIDNNTTNNTNNNNIYNSIFDYYINSGLIKHKQLTPAIIKALKQAEKELKLDEDYFKRIIDRHKQKVEATKNKGKYATKKRTLSELFGQKKSNSINLICSDYLDGEWEELKIKGGDNQEWNIWK